MSGSRLDHVLRLLYPNTPRRLLLNWLLQGAVRLDGRVARKGQLVSTGQQMTVTVPEAEEAPTETRFQLCQLLETPDFVVLDKPAGQASSCLEGGARNSIADLLLRRYPDMVDVGHGARDAGLVHRLDTGTSGVIVAAKTRVAFARLTQALRQGELNKVYLAWTAGTMPSPYGTIEVPLEADPSNRRRVVPAKRRHQSTHPVHKTHYEVLATSSGITLVRVSAPVASRHQIRAHLASVECPLLGDELYGGASHPQLARHALHAWRVSYRGAAGCNAFDCTSPPPEDVRGLIPLALPD